MEGDQQQQDQAFYNAVDEVRTQHRRYLDEYSFHLRAMQHHQAQLNQALIRAAQLEGQFPWLKDDGPPPPLPPSAREAGSPEGQASQLTGNEALNDTETIGTALEPIPAGEIGAIELGAARNRRRARS